MATYRGERYVGEQISSILEQLSPDDELVIVDDASPDGTVQVIRSFSDARIRLIEQRENFGYVRTFEHALVEARGDVLLLSDQDDVWAPGRVDVLCAALEGADVVASNLDLLRIDANGSSATTDSPIQGPLGIREWRLPRVGKRAQRRNALGVLLGIMPYFGCAMGMKRSFMRIALPFPEWLTESHDLWIALCGNFSGRLNHISAVTTYRRLHDQNASTLRPRSFRLVLRSRLLVLQMMREACRRNRLSVVRPLPRTDK